MRILIADKLSEEAQNILKEDGHEVTFDPNLKDEPLEAAIKTIAPSILVVRSTKVTADSLAASDSLQLVVRAGAGVNTIDLAKASELGVFVANCPGKNAVAVAELTIGLMLSLDRRIPDNVIQLRDKVWNKKEFGKASGLKGRTLGLIGMGSIGAEVAKRALALEMNVIAWSRSLNDEKAKQLGVTRMNSAIDVAKASQFVSVHVAVTADTKGMCNKAFFEAMPEGSCFINTSRGEVVDEAAMLKAIESKNIRCGLDVFLNEPSAGNDTWSSEVSLSPSVYGTHHIGASTDQATEAIGDEALRVIRTFAQTGKVENCVNLEDNPPATHLLNVRHVNKVGVLAAVLDELQKAGINVLNMRNELFSGDKAAVASIGVNTAPASSVIKSISSSSEAIISVSVKER